MDDREPESSCGTCGAALSARDPEGLCPACLLRTVLTDDDHRLQTPTVRPAPPTVMELTPLFPDYRVLEPVGQGGMGAVYKAVHCKLDRPMALKVIIPPAQEDPAFAGRFVRESRALARLDHPGIVGIHDFGQVGGCYFLIMDFAPGVNLRRIMQERRLRQREIVDGMPQVLEALQYAHDQGVIHRDLKPENLMVSPEGRVRITDFGLAKLIRDQDPISSLTGTGQSPGTPHYMAPEQIHEPDTVDARSDLFAIGVIIYELLTGRLPIGNFQRPSELVAANTPFDDLVLKALHGNPDKRYPSAREMAGDLAAISLADSGPASVGKVRTPPPLPIRTRRLDRPAGPGSGDLDDPSAPAGRRHEPEASQEAPRRDTVGGDALNMITILSLVVLVASFMTWGSLRVSDLIGTSFIDRVEATMKGNHPSISSYPIPASAWITHVFTIPNWLVVVAALFLGSLAQLHRCGQVVVRSWVFLMGTAWCLVQCLAFNICLVSTSGASVGAGLVIATLAILSMGYYSATLIWSDGPYGKGTAAPARHGARAQAGTTGWTSTRRSGTGTEGRSRSGRRSAAPSRT